MTKDEEIWILSDRRIQLSFDTKGYAFYMGGRGVLGIPQERFLRLIAVKGDLMLEISSISDLRGRVSLTTPEDSLEFVRLFTSVATHYLFPESDLIEAVESDDSPGLATYTSEYAFKMNLMPAIANRVGEDFVVERNLFNKQRELFRVTEQVSSDGGYTLKGALVIDRHSPPIYPIYQ